LKLQNIRITKNNSLSLEWNNIESVSPSGNGSADSAEITEIQAVNLRKFCPCAVCIEERQKQSVSYIPVFLQDQLIIKNINLIGNYGISLQWGDGHSTGIYEFDLLYRISKFAKSPPIVIDPSTDGCRDNS